MNYTNKNTVLMLVVAVFFVTLSQSDQNIPQPTSWSIENKIKKIKSHVFVLASDSLEGREVGTNGELLAADYISNYFKQINIAPLKDSSHYQEFS